MRVIIAKNDTEQPRDDDFCHTDAGELLTFPAIVCEGPKAHRDACGCGRAFAGIDSQRATTYGVVAEWDERDVFDALANCATAEDWKRLDPECADLIRQEAVSLYEMATDLPVGTEVRIINSPSSSELIALVRA